MNFFFINPCIVTFADALHEMQCRSYITVTDVLRMYLKHANDKFKLLNDKLKNVNPKLEGYQFLRLIFSGNKFQNLH